MELGLEKLPRPAQVGVFVLLAAGGIAAFLRYYEAPMRAEMAVREKQLETLRADISKGNATARRLPEFRSQVAELESHLENLNAILPSEKDAADLLRRLQTIAVQSNLTIRSFKPAPPVNKPTHAEWPIALELDGTYHNLAIFFDRVGKFTRIINISNLDVKAKDKPESGSTITAGCIATTFVLNKEGAASGRGGKPPAVPGKGA
jgi:type IV pilus assembly protein PilO